VVADEAELTVSRSRKVLQGRSLDTFARGDLAKNQGHAQLVEQSPEVGRPTLILSNRSSMHRRLLRAEDRGLIASCSVSILVDVLAIRGGLRLDHW